MTSTPRPLAISRVRVAKTVGPTIDRVVDTVAHLRNPGLQAASENELILSEQLIARAYSRHRPSQRSGSDDRMPEERSEKSNHNNAKDKARVS